MEAADKVGIEGAAEFLDDPNNGVKEVKARKKKEFLNSQKLNYRHEK